MDELNDCKFMENTSYKLAEAGGIAMIIRVIRTGLLLCVCVQLISCQERTSTITNHTNTDSANFVTNCVELDSANFNHLQNKSKRIKESVDSVYNAYVKRFEGNYWYVSTYRCGRENYKSIGRGLDTVIFFFATEKNLFIDNKKVGTWELKKINEVLILMNLNIENSIEEIYLPSFDYWFIYANDSVSVLQTRYGKSEDEVLTYQITLKTMNCIANNVPKTIYLK